MPITRVASGNGVGTSAAINTTGANLLIVVTGYDSGATITDNKGNTWTGLTARVDGALTARIYYCVSPSVGTGHTVTSSISYAAVALLAYAGVDTASPFDAQTGLDGISTLVTTYGIPSLTPANANELIVFAGAFAQNGGDGLSVDSGFTVRQTLPAVTSVSYGVGVADLIQTTAAAVSPIFTWVSASRVATTMAAFKAAAAGPATAITLTGPSSGSVGLPSTNFTVGANGTITGTITVTPNDGGGGGTFTPTSVAISSGTPTATFTYTAASAGTKTIGVTNSGGLSNPSSISYVASPPVGLTSAAVASNGQDVTLTLGASSTIALSDVTVRVGGVIVYPVGITGAGTSWTVTMGRRWLLNGSTVTVTLGTSTVTASNASIITTRSTEHVGRGFGLFLHFGPGTWSDVEWTDPATFNVNSFSPTTSIVSCIDQWIACAQVAGMRYVVLTTKHHDGFCLWPSASTTFDIASTTWYASNGNPDIVGIFCQRVRAAGLGVGLYFSPWDRKFELDNPSATAAAYQAYIQSQITELLTNYGPVDLLWLDGWNWLTGGGVSITTLPYASIVTFARGLQPNCAIIANNHREVLTGTGSNDASDLLEYEGGSLGSQTPTTNKLPAEECDTIRGDNQWFWKTAADVPLDAATVTSELARINGRSASYLLNCPPNRTGLIEDAIVRVLAQVGATRAEFIGGPVGWTGTGSARSFSVTLTTNGSTPAASVSGVRWAVYDVPNPAQHERPIAQGIGSTSAGGVLTGSFLAGLSAGAVVWLTASTSDGTVPAGTGATGFAGPVALS